MSTLLCVFVSRERTNRFFFLYAAQKVILTNFKHMQEPGSTKMLQLDKDVESLHLDLEALKAHARDLVRNNTRASLFVFFHLTRFVFLGV